MRKRWLMCALMGALAWGQAATAQGAPGQNAAPKGATQAPAEPEPRENKAAAKPAEPKEIPMSAVVLTIKGVCPASATAKTAAGKTSGGKAGASKTAAKKPECETKITREQFEKIANGLSPNVTPQFKRQLEQALPRFMAMSEIAKKKGLENTERYKETIKIARMQILTQELQRQAQEQADNVPQAEIEKYYKDNPEAYEQSSLDRLFIPRYKTVQAEAKTEENEERDEKELTPEQQKAKEDEQKAKEAEDKKKQEEGEQELNKLADTLRERAAAGEDFVKLQKEAFAAAGTKVENPTVNLPKVRRTGLPPAHAEVFDLKVGEVSKVISDNGGHYIYKVVSKQELPLDQVQAEIHNKLKSERLKETMDKYTNSFSVEPNEEYFGPATAPPGRMRPGMGRPMPNQSVPPPRAGQGPGATPPSSAPAPGGANQSAPPSTPPPANSQPPAQTPPPSKQN
jgi:hypothetical protein